MLVKGLRVELGGRLVLEDVSLELSPGVTAVLGPNGSGKTTLLRTIIGMIRPKEGEVVLDGYDLSFVPAEVYPASLTVVNVLKSGKRRGEYEKYVKLLGIEGLLYRDFSTLSTGQKKLVLIAKALAEGDLVVMDEPLSGLDPRNRKLLLEVILSLKGEKSFLMTSHELELLRYSDRVVVMKEGRVVFSGPTRELTEEAIYEVYGVRVKKVVQGDDVIFCVD
ncbi:MAG: ABC transporter ATP-binding protein [Thermoprotei archaeon]